MAVVSKKNTSSPVWTYFGFEADKVGNPKNEQVAICRLCEKHVSTKASNTSNLFSHLRYHHPAEYNMVRAPARSRSTAGVSPAMQSTIVDSLVLATKYARNSKRWKELTDAITHCIAKDMLPIYTVEKSGFRQMVAAFDSRYQMPSRSYFSRTAIPALYAQVCESVRRDLTSTKFRFYSATTDLWSSLTAEPFISFTVHYIDENWKLHNRCLQTLYMPQAHTGINLADILRETIEMWNLNEESLVCLTTDSGANIVRAVEMLEWSRLSCFGHNLHNAVNNSIKDDSRVCRSVGMCHKLVGSFSHSWKRQQSLSKAQVELDLPKHSLVTECTTRWGSKQKMIERILEQEPAIRQVLSLDRKSAHLIPTWQDLEVLESISKALDPLSEFTDILSGEDYVTISSVRPLLHHLTSQVCLQKEGDTELTKDIKTAVKLYMEHKYEDTKTVELINVASALDPRFKMDYIKEEDLENVKDKIVHEGSEFAQSVTAQMLTSCISTEAEAEPPSKKKRLGSIFKKPQVDKQSSSTPSQERVRVELTMYLQCPQPDAESDPLVWWKSQEKNFPILAMLARKYLCICATSTASERLFSTSGNVVTPKRACLKPDMINMLVFLARNI